MELREATEKDISEIVKLHQEVFQGFFLTSLGARFLHELYWGFIWEESGVLLVARDGVGLMGFAAGSVNPNRFFKNLFRKRWLSFSLKAISAAARNPLPVSRKVVAAIWFRGDVPVNIQDGAVLSSIGVSAQNVGKGVARELLKHFEVNAQQEGIKRVFLTTDEKENDRANAFYLKNNYVIESKILKFGNRIMYRYVKNLVDNDTKENNLS